MQFPVTYIIIGITALISYFGFQNVDIINKAIFYPKQIKDNKEYWRFITSGFIHADMQHLIFNMLSLYFFGRMLEMEFSMVFGNPFVYPVFYILALIASNIPVFKKQENNYYYRALGASGAVSAVIFATIIFEPWMMINFIIPGFVFAIGYIVYSNYMSKRNADNIGHDAHLYGALFGIAFPLVFKPQLIQVFLTQLMHPPFL